MLLFHDSRGRDFFVFINSNILLVRFIRNYSNKGDIIIENQENREKKVLKYTKYRRNILEMQSAYYIDFI